MAIKNWVIGGLVVALVAAFIFGGGPYQLISTPDEKVVYKINRLTGKVWICSLGRCQSLIEQPGTVK